MSHTYRINELRPKAKLIVSHAYSKKQLELSAKEQRHHKIAIELSPRRRESVPTETMHYDKIKPLFNWNKISLLCGGEHFQLG